MLLCRNHFIVSIFDSPEYPGRLLNRVALEVPLGVLAFEHALIGFTLKLLVIQLHPLEKAHSFLVLRCELCLSVYLKPRKSDKLTLSPVILP